LYLSVFEKRLDDIEAALSTTLFEGSIDDVIGAVLGCNLEKKGLQ
jgi:hypothetical protein